MFVGVVPATLLIVRSYPAAMGLAPDGISKHEHEAAPAAPSIPFSQAFKSRFFIAVALTFLFALGSQTSGIAHIFRLANTRVDAETAAIAVALLAMASLTGRLIVGRLLLRTSVRTMTFALILIQALGLTALAFAGNGATILLSTVLFGCTSGSILMMQPLLLAEAFGLRHYGRIYSLSHFVGVFGSAIGPSVLGVLYEASGGYAIPYLTVAATSLAGIVMLKLSGPTRQIAD
jgi:predicted MFS family arabinose efflux permease